MPIPLLALGLALAAGHTGQRALWAANQRQKQSSYTDTIDTITELYGGVGGLDPMAGGAMAPGQGYGGQATNQQGPMSYASQPGGQQPQQPQQQRPPGQGQAPNPDTVMRQGMALMANPDTFVQGNQLYQAGIQLAQDQYEFNQENYTTAEAQTVAAVSAEQARLSSALNALRDDVRAIPQLADYGAAVRQWQQLQALPDTPAGDTARMFGIMKILDPRSTVREGEVAMVSDTGSAFDRAARMYNNVINGQKLDPKQRAEIEQVAFSTLKSYQEQAQPFVESYQAMAKFEGVDPALFLSPYMFNPTGTPRPVPADRPPPGIRAPGELPPGAPALPEGYTLEEQKPAWWAPWQN